MSSDACSMTATQIVADISSGKLTAEAVMTDHLARINARDSAVNAFIDFDPDRALKLARAADRQTKKGILHGVPLAVKDIIDTLDMPTAWGSPIYADFQAPRNASCVEMFLLAGAIPIGKTVTTEFAYFSPGPTRNPHNLEHTPGGSSSGSAAAVADGMAMLGLGSQTAASSSPYGFTSSSTSSTRVRGPTRRFPPAASTPMARGPPSILRSPAPRPVTAATRRMTVCRGEAQTLD